MASNSRSDRCQQSRNSQMGSKYDWDLYLSWRPAILGTKYTVSQPLDQIPSLPPRDPTGRTFQHRLKLLVPVLKVAQQDLVMPDEVAGRRVSRRPAEELAMTILLVAYVLLEPYLSEDVPSSLQPFRKLIEDCRDRIGNGPYACEAKEECETLDLRRKLYGALSDLLDRTMTMSRQSPLDLLGLDHRFRYPVEDDEPDGHCSPSPRAQTDDMLALLDTASQRNLSLSESRRLSDCLKEPSLSQGLNTTSITPEHFASIAIHTPRIALELVTVLSLTGKEGDSDNSFGDPTLYFQVTGSRLPVNESRSYAFVLKILNFNGTRRDAVAVAFAVYTQLMPTYLSRCFSALMRSEAVRRRENGQFENSISGEEDDNNQEMETTREGSRRRRGVEVGGEGEGDRSFPFSSSLNEPTSRELDSLLGFLQRTALFDLLGTVTNRVEDLEEYGRGVDSLRRQHQQQPPDLKSIATILSRSQNNENDIPTTFSPSRSRSNPCSFSTSSPSDITTTATIITEEQGRKLYETLEIIAVEIKAFALDMVRYRSAGQLLRRLI